MENCITKQELEQMIKNKEMFQLIDVRSEEEFNESHIPFAVNIPINELKESLKSLDSNKLIITTCGMGGGRSKSASEILRDSKFNSKYLDKGTFGWFEK